jgi:hypothetical protein
MPHRSNDRGSLILKRKFRGVPLIRRATGTSDPKVVEQIDLMLASLYNQGRLDVLEAIAAGALHPLQALSCWRQGRELALLPADVLPSLTQAWTAWADRLPPGEHRRKVMGTMRALSPPASATIADVARLLVRYRQQALPTPRSFNLARAHVRAFLRDTVGTTHELYRAAKDLRPLPVGMREKGTPHEPAVIIALCGLCPGGMGRLGPMTWTMAATGMGNKEYWHDGFEILIDRVAIKGKKRSGRERVVPRWGERELTQPLVSEKVFRRELRIASSGSVQIYDLRRSFARWCEEAGIISTNRDAYLGHGPRSMTGLYTYGQLPGQLEADAAKLSAYLARSLGR